MRLPGAIDHEDMFPRYYFDFEAAKSETIKWLKTRDQFDDSEWIEGAGDFEGNCCGMESRDRP